MKTFMLFGILAFTLHGLQEASAAEKLRKNETYCMQSNDGSRGGSSQILWCSYETLAQCQASKTSLGDQCMLNPVLAFAQREREMRKYR